MAVVSTDFAEVVAGCAAPDRRVAPELPAADLSVSITPEDPIDRVDAAAFAARALAASLHGRLAEAGQNCLRLKVKAELADGSVVERIWRTREALTEEATADRVRWQLDGWLTSGGAGTITSSPCRQPRSGCQNAEAMARRFAADPDEVITA